MRLNSFRRDGGSRSARGSQNGDGWFTLTVIMSVLLAERSKNDQDLDFMTEAGERLSERFPVRSSSRLGELQDELNDRLSELGLGRCELIDDQNSILIDHFDIPPVDREDQDIWNDLVCCMLMGLYDGWFHQSGCPESLGVVFDRQLSDNEAHFRLCK